MKRWCSTLLVLAVAGLSIAGCSESSARRVSNPAQANLRLENGGQTTISVFAELIKIGEVRQGELIDFDVGQGTKKIELRETGGSVQLQGDWRFTTRNLLELSYRTATSANFVVTNLENEDLYALVDGVALGTVTPGQTLSMSVPLGIRDVGFRLSSEPVSTTWGSLRFASDNAFQITFNQ